MLILTKFHLYIWYKKIQEHMVPKNRGEKKHIVGNKTNRCISQETYNTSLLRSCGGLPGEIEEGGDPCSLVVDVETERKRMVTWFPSHLWEKQAYQPWSKRARCHQQGHLFHQGFEDHDPPTRPEGLLDDCDIHLGWEGGGRDAMGVLSKWILQYTWLMLISENKYVY